MGWINRRKLDEYVFKLQDLGIYVSRHSYSYRLIYKDRMLLGIHVYPGNREISVRLYMDSGGNLHREVLQEILLVTKETFPNYRVSVTMYYSVVHGESHG